MKTFNFIGKVNNGDYFYFAHKYPKIRHFLWRYKPRNPYINHIEDLWFFERKSKVYNYKAETYHQIFKT